MYKIEEIQNKIIQGDCINIFPKIPDNSIDLIVTSPPYNCGIKYDIYNDNKKWNEYYDWCREWLKHCLRVLKNDGRMCLNHYLSVGNSDSRHSPLMDLNSISKEIGFKHHGIAMWTDPTICKLTAWGSYLSASSPYISCPYEGILILYKDKWKKENKGISTIDKKHFIQATSGVWNIPTDKNRLTMATFPIALPLLCINLLTYKDDLVLDCFSGSGTTAVASVKLNRRYIGIELSPTYHKISINRIEKYKQQKSFPNIVYTENYE